MPDPAPQTEFPNLQGSGPSAESDIGELAALFAAHGGDSLPAKVSADLALEIVLNEIVEQACLATGATGAAIVLDRDGEMVCRASSGANAPELGAPLSSEFGLTAECVNTRQIQRCDDTQTDPRADAEASRSLGVRSVMVFPLLRNGEMNGVLEVFSARPGAFGERDELTLETLARRIMKNLDLASDTASISDGTAASHSAADAVALIPAAEPVEPASVAGMEASTAISAGSPVHEEDKEERDSPIQITEQSPRSGFDVVTVALVAAVVACAVLLGTLMGVRLGWRRASGAREQISRSGPDAGVDTQAPANGASAQNSKSADNDKKNQAVPTSTPSTGGKDSFPPAGGLLVYENGKEVFRMPPAGQGETAKTAHGETAHSNKSGTRGELPKAAAGKESGGVPGNVERASAVEPAGMVDLAPAAAEGSLLHRVEPDYPEVARQRRIQGAVVLDVRIGRDGSIQDVKLVSGQPLLSDAAIAAVKQWRFKPRTLKGQPVEMQTRVTLNFRMPA